MFQHHQSKIYRQNGSAADCLLFTPFPSGRGDTLEHQNHIYRRTGTVSSPPTKHHTIDWRLTTNQLTAEQTNQTASPRRRIRCFVTELNLHACMDGWAGGWLGGRLLISSGRPCWSAAGFGRRLLPSFREFQLSLHRVVGRLRKLLGPVWYPFNHSVSITHQQQPSIIRN